MKNLKYRIYSISSQSKQYPASNLTIGNGWQTQRLCKYPQEITIQFFVPMKTKSLKLMFHQYKIPKLIEVFIKATKIEKFRKLGFVRPSDNSQSGYENKELKTIFFEFPCSYIKLILHENYKNEFNLFEQVGLEELSVQGQIVSASQLRNYDQTEIQTQEQQQMQEQVQNNSQNKIQPAKNKPVYEPILYPDLFKNLQQQKKIAIQREDFQKASQVKNIIVTFQNLERQILQLQQQKKIAIEQEDYDKAHQMKKLIINKKEILQYQIKNVEQGLEPSNYYSRVTQSQNRSYINPSYQQTAVKYQSPKKSLNDHDNQILPALKKKMQQQAGESNVQHQTKQKTQQQSSIYQNSLLEVDHNYYKNFHAQSPQHQFQQLPIQQPNILEIEKLQPLQPNTRRKLQHYFPYIHEDNWRRALSKNWKSRNYALNELITMNITHREQFLAILQFISYTIQDSHTNVVLNTLTLLKNLIASQVQVTLTHLPFYIQTIINSLISMLNENKPKIKEQAFLIYINLADMSIIPLSLAVHSIMKHKSKVKSDPRHICIKIELIKSLIEKYPQCSQYYHQILNWVASLIEDPNNDVRNSASNLLIILSFQLGKERVLNALKNIPPNIYANFKQNLNMSLECSKLQSSNLQQQQKSMLHHQSHRQSKISNKKHNNPSQLEINRIHQSPIGQRNLKESEDVDLAYSQQSLFKTQRSQKSYEWSSKFKHQQQNAFKDQIKVMDNNGQECEYCFMENIININKHLTSECPALVYCQGCGGRIYLRQMTQHLLQMCDKINHQQCKRCGRAYELDQINEHVALNNCVPLRRDKQRCQFCGQDINPDDYSWVQHCAQCRDLPIGVPSLQSDSEQVSKEHY